jgi:WD40 repeat protein
MFAHSRYVASSAADCTMRLWDVAEGKQAKCYDTVCAVNDCAFGADDKLIVRECVDVRTRLRDGACAQVGALWNGSLVIFDVHEATLLRTLDVSSASLQRVSWRAGGVHLATTDARGGVSIVAASSGALRVRVCACVYVCDAARRHDRSQRAARARAARDVVYVRPRRQRERGWRRCVICCSHRRCAC